MTIDIAKFVTEEESSLVHRAMIAAFNTVEFPGQHETVKPDIRFLVAQPKYKNKDSSFTDKETAPRYPSITVFCFQPIEEPTTRVEQIRDVYPDPDDPEHNLVAVYDFPNDFSFRYQVHLASDRQDYHDLLFFKVMKLFRKQGGDKAVVIKNGAYEVKSEVLTTRPFPDEGTQTTDIDFMVRVPIMFLSDPDQEGHILPAIEEVIIEIGIPDKLQDLDECDDHETISTAD